MQGAISLLRSPTGLGKGELNRKVNAFPVSRFRFTWIDLAVTSLLANQPVASESGHARDRCLRAVVTPQVNLSFSFLSRVPRHLNYSFSDWLTILCLAVFTLFTDLITNSNCLQIQTVTPGLTSYYFYCEVNLNLRCNVI